MNWRLCLQTSGIFRFWPETAGSGASRTACSRNPGPEVGARVASPHGSILRPGEKSVADLDTRRQHRTFHLLIKPDILTCYQQFCRKASDRSSDWG